MARFKRQTLVSLALTVSLLFTTVSVLADDAVINDDAITVVENSVDYNFAQQITFTLEATTTVQVSKVYLFFAATSDERTESFDVPFAQEGNTLSVTYLHDPRPSPLPPFDTITFWWQIEYGSESTIIPRESFEYIDDRFTWEQLADEESRITIHWDEEEGNVTFGQTALDVARASLEDISAELRAPLPESIDIYIYNTQENLKQAMVMTGRDWVSGQAHPELGVIIVAIPANAFAISHIKRDIPHEITHLLVYQAVTPEGYKHVPEWLDEGLATTHEREPNPDYGVMLKEARQEGRLIPLQDLCVPFSPNMQIAYLAYAQSGSVVKYIRERYGAQGIRDLLTAYKNGASCTSGVKEVLGIDIYTLETDWRASLEPLPQPQTQTPLPAWVQQAWPAIGFWLLMSLPVAIPMTGRMRRRQ